MTTFIQLVVAGLTIGVIYGIIGVAFVVLHRVSGILNFAIPDLIMVAAIGSVYLPERHDFPRFVAIVGVVVVLAVIGYLFERFFLTPAVNRGSGLIHLLLLTFALSIALRGLALISFGRDTYSAPPLIGGEPFMILGASVQRQSLLFVLIGLVAAGGLALFFRSTVYGKAMSATASNQRGAWLVGINPGQMRRVAFVASVVVSALVGIVLISVIPFEYTTAQVGFWGLVAAAVVGLDRPQRALVAGVAIGVLQLLLARYISASFQTAIAYTALIVLLLVRPQLTSVKVSR
ncbi:MAG: hypothetical protein ABS81_06160 [Pseudonocardia sp. SCN 72-86]|nr:MAG: hypothetical protein ABS81_06160 [Pseudonocardia sp. SCN 72-86]